jgi:hypothetical protein
MTGLHSFYGLIVFYCVYTTHFLYLSADGSLGCFPFLGHCEYCYQECKCLFDIFILSPLRISSVGLLDHTVALFLTIWGTSILFSIVAILIYIPTNILQGFLSLIHPYQHFLSLVFFVVATITGVWSDFSVVLICISLKIVILYFLNILTIYTTNVYFDHLSIFSWIVWLLNCFISLYIFDINSLLDK